MNTFDVSLTADTWVEVLNGGTAVAFDVLPSPYVEVFLNEGGTPTGNGNKVESWPADWDFELIGAPDGQMVWVRSVGRDNAIRGVR